MNRLRRLIFVTSFCFIGILGQTVAEPLTNHAAGGVPSVIQDTLKKTLNLGVVNFKTCVEKSKLGKKEQEGFDAMKKHMESLLDEKEKALNEMASKFNDDYLDTLSPEAETELKRKFRTMSQDLNQTQNQYYQTLNQENFKVLQKISGSVASCSAKVAKEKALDLILNEDSLFYYAPELDISTYVIKEMDALFDSSEKSNSGTSQP